MLLKRCCSGIFGALLALTSNVGVAGEHPASLQLSVWGGSHLAMLQHVVMSPFTALTGARLEPRARVGNHADVSSSTADVVELELQDAIDSCDKGELSLLPAGDPAAHIADYVPNGLQPCAIGQYVWSTIFAYDRGAYKVGDQPSLISDFFDVRHYPGRRAVRRSSRVLSEWALLTAGIPATRIYQVLDQPDLAWQIIERVLNPIARSIVWVDDDAQAMEMLNSGTVAFAMLGSDSLVRAVVAGADKLQPVWDGAVNQMSLWAIPANANNPELARKFVSYATSVDTTRRFSAISGYGPARFASLEQINKSYHQYLPTIQSNLSNVVWSNSSWWRDHGATLDQLFVDWLSSQFVKTGS